MKIRDNEKNGMKGRDARALYFLIFFFYDLLFVLCSYISRCNVVVSAERAVAITSVHTLMLFFSCHD